MRELTNMEKDNLLWLAPALGAEFILYAFRHSIVHITGINNSGDVHAGTGLMIDPFWVLTCAHVINEMTLDEKQVFGGQTLTIKRSLTHPSIDVGLLEISPGFISVKGMAFRNPRVAETIFILGFPRIPLSREPSLVIHRGEITNTEITTFSEQKLFLYSAIARPGNSGGPVISSSGNVVGLITEELLGQDSPIDSFYAGVGGGEVARAISEFDVPIKLPVENYA